MVNQIIENNHVIEYQVNDSVPLVAIRLGNFHDMTSFHVIEVVRRRFNKYVWEEDLNHVM